jgi:hypothetical protein
MTIKDATDANVAMLSHVLLRHSIPEELAGKGFAADAHLGNLLECTRFTHD